MTGFLEALGHNPEASLDFLNDETGTGSDRITNFQYLVGNGDHARKWPEGADGYDELGHALESATLGYAYDSKDPAIPPMRTEAEIEARDARTALAQQVVEAYGDPELLEKQEGIVGSLANVAAGHIDSINYTMENWAGTGDLVNRDGFYGKDEAQLRDFGYGSAKAFLRNLAADEDAHQTLTSAQQVYGTSLMAAHGDSQDDVMLAANRSVRMHGLIDEPRLEALGVEFNDAKEKKILEQEQKAAWVEYGVGAAVGAGAGLITAPAGGIGAVAVHTAAAKGSV